MEYYLYKHMANPKEDEYYTIEEYYKMSKSNVAILRNICFYLNGKKFKDSDCIHDINRINELLHTFYFDFFFDSIDCSFIDEPLKIEVLTRHHINELTSVYNNFSEDIERFKPNEDIITSTKELQTTISQVIEHLNFFTSERKTELIINTPPILSELHSPFRDNDTKELFDYLVKNWSNKNANKWGYIWQFLVVQGKGKLTTKTDYENYLRIHKGFTEGKPNYDSCNSKKHYDKLTELYENFKQI